jgi:hypothetical protein
MDNSHRNRPFIAEGYIEQGHFHSAQLPWLDDFTAKANLLPLIFSIPVRTGFSFVIFKGFFDGYSAVSRQFVGNAHGPSLLGHAHAIIKYAIKVMAA